MFFSTGYDELLTLTFNKYLDSQDKKDAVDQNGRSVFQIIVQFSSCDDERKNTLICRCMQNSCSPFIFDQNEKLAIDYCKPGDVCYHTLSEIVTDTGNRCDCKHIFNFIARKCLIKNYPPPKKNKK